MADDILSSRATLFSQKAEGLARHKEDKVQNFGWEDTRSSMLAGATQPQTPTTPFTTQTVDRLVDADSAILKGKPNEVRFSGFDAYEVQHNDPESIAYFKSPQGQKKIERQKEFLGKQLGIDPSAVTTDMIYKEGEKQKLDALYTMMGRPKGADGKEWTPGPIGYSPTRDGGIQLGSKTNPLGLKIQEQDLGKDYYGRGLSNIADTHGKLLTDRFNTPTQNTDYGTVYGANGSTAKPHWDSMPGTTGNSRIADDVAIAKAAGIQLGAGAIRMVNKVATAIGLNGVMDKLDAAVGGTGHAGMFLKDKDDLPFTNKSIKEVLDPKKGQAVADAMAGLSPEARATFSGAMQHSEGQWEKGDYLGSMWTAAKHLDQMLAQSTPEMAALFIPYAGAATVAATRASNQAEMYKQNNPGKEYDASQYAGSFLANMALLLPEKLLIKSGMADVFGKAAKGGHATAMAKSTAGETAQEYGEGVQETYATQKDGAHTLGEVMTDSKQVYQGAVGGLMGGAMHGGGVALSEGPRAIAGMADKGLTAVAEKGTGKTVESIKQKYADQAAVKANIESRRVPITETMSAEHVELATDINSMLDDAHLLDAKSPNYDHDLKDTLRRVDQMKDIINPATTETATTAQEPEVSTTKQEEQIQDAVEAAIEKAPITRDAEVDTKVQAAGLTNILTLDDKKSNMSVQHLYDEGTSVRDASTKKNRLIDPSSMTDERVAKVLSGDIDAMDFQSIVNTKIGKAANTVKRMIKKMNPLNKEIAPAIKKVAERVESAMKDTNAVQHLNALFGDKVSKEKAMRVLALTIDGVNKGMDAEVHIAKNNGKEYAPVARRAALAQQLGKELMNSYDMKLGGTAKDTAAKYQQLGEEMIKFALATGSVSEGKQDVSVHNMVTPENKSVRNSESELKSKYRGKDGMIPMDTLSVIQNTRESKSEATAMKEFSKLFRPVNYVLPTKEAVSEVPFNPNSPISKEHQKIIENYNKMEYSIKPEMIQMLKAVKAYIGDRDTDKVLASDPVLINLLGLRKSKADIRKESEGGKAINKKKAITDLLDNLEMFDDNGVVHFNFESAVNTRIHVMQTILDFQGDKFMARQLLRGGNKPKAISTKRGKDLLINSVADELKYVKGTQAKISEVTNPTNKVVLRIMKKLDEGTTPSISDMATLANEMKVGSPWKALSLVQAMADIRKAGGGAISTNYQVEVDASASGLVNTLLNLAHNPSVQGILSTLGIGVLNGAKADPYLFIDSKLSLNDKAEQVLQDLDSVGMSRREVAKYPIMKWVYGQNYKNTQKDMGESIGEDLLDMAFYDYNQDAMNLVNKVLGTDYKIDSASPSATVQNLSAAEEKQLAKHFEDTLGAAYTNAISEAFSPIAEYRDTMAKVYSALQSTGKWDSSIETAMSAMLDEGKAYKMSVQKLKEVLHQDADGKLYTVNDMLDNETSFNVNLQHSTDAALLLLSIKNVLGDDLAGVMTVHDALYSDAELGLKIMDGYNTLAREAAVKYDFVGTALKELKKAISAMEGSVEENADKRALKKQYDALYAKNTEDQKAKAEYLKNLELNIIGDWTVGNELANERATTTSSGEKPTTKDEVKEANDKVATSARAVLSTVKKALEAGDIATAIDTLSSMNVSETHKDLLGKVRQALRGVEIQMGDKFTGGYDAITLGKASSSMTTDTLVEILAHEVDHAIQLEWMVANKDATEMKYLSRVVERLKTMKGLSTETQDRVNYILNPKKEYDENDTQAMRQVSELVSILSNEQKVAEEILSKFGGNGKTIMQTIKDLIAKAYKSFKELLGEKDVNDLEIDTDTIMSAIQSLDDNARANTIHATLQNRVQDGNHIADAKDTNKDVFMAPYNAVNDVVVKSNAFMSDWMIIWGDTMIEHMGPPLRNAHVNLKRNSALYKSAVSMLRNGFYDSDFAQRMHYLLGVAGDVKDKVVKEALRLSNEYQQESVKQLEEMAILDRALKETYSTKNQKKLFKMFANTGIANLTMNEEIFKGVMSGEMTYQEAMDKVSTEMDVGTKAKLDKIATGSGFLGEHTNGDVNVFSAGIYSKEAQVYVTLKALERIPKSQQLLVDMNADIRNQMLGLALINKKLNDELNEKSKDYRGMKYSDDAGYHGLYDGSFSMDMHEHVYESKVVTLSQLRRSENSSEHGWFVVQQPTDSEIGVISRINYEAGYQTGTGLEKNRYANGIILSKEQSKPIMDELKAIGNKDDAIEWLDRNNLVQDGERFRVKVSAKVKAEKLSLIENAAHSLYRTKMHNTDLIASESVRRILLEAGTRSITSANGMKELERILKQNDREGLRGTRTEVEPFITIDYTAASLKHIKSFDDLKAEYPMVAKYFKTPEGLTSFNDFNRKVSLVKRGVSEVLLGYKKGQIFGNENRDAAQWEQMFKKMIILAKQKMVVMNPVKLLNDTITNAGVLSMMDMTPTEIYSGMKEGYEAYREFSAARGKMVELKMAARLADAKWEMDKTKENETARKNAIRTMDMHGEKMKSMAFYDAYNAGFVQSYSTDLVIKEMDTISGIQNDIDKVVDKYTHDKKGNPNKLFDAIKWFANTGPQMDEILLAAGNSAKMKGTDVGTELVAVAERLKNKKNDKDSVSRYVSEFIGSPSSEAAAYGSAYMVLGDVMSKYALAKHLIGKENPRTGKRGERRVYTKEEAYSLANDTFIDYRANLPREIQVLSDYGILMFPAYWMRVQKVIAGLIKYHPVSALVSYGTEMAMGAESLNVLNQNVISKSAAYGGLIHSPTDSISLHGIIFGFGAM